MSRIRSSLLQTLAIGGLLSMLALPAAAQDERDGLIRISDSSPSKLAPVPEGQWTGSNSCPNCPQSGGVTYGSGDCQPYYGHCYSRKLHQILDWFNPYGMCTFSPDHGFSPPVKRPIYRTPVTYRKAFPDCWTGAPQGGQPVRVPTVYTPTDTTQLGYYYQHVPYWQLRAGAIPPAPQPEAWHTPLSAVPADPHAAGIVLGTAPVIGQEQGLFMETATPFVESPQPTTAQGSAQELERSAFMPSLLPVE